MLREKGMVMGKGRQMGKGKLRGKVMLRDGPKGRLMERVRERGMVKEMGRGQK